MSQATFAQVMEDTARRLHEAGAGPNEISLAMGRMHAARARGAATVLMLSRGVRVVVPARSTWWHRPEDNPDNDGAP
jgi:hypothetical protein